jgi:hypothetical protein
MPNSGGKLLLPAAGVMLMAICLLMLGKPSEILRRFR